MSRATKSCCLIFIIYNTLALTSRAQSTPEDTAAARKARDYAIQQYHAWLAPETGFYRGGEYADYLQVFREGQPFFDKDRMQKGAVVYNGMLYQDVPLIYDLVKGLLVTYAPQNAYKIALISQQIDSFSIGNSSFVHLTDSFDRDAPRPGFYQILYKGSICILKKEKKMITEQPGYNGIERYIGSSSSYYMKKDGHWYSVNSKGGLLTALHDKSKDIKKFMRKNELRMSEDKDNTLIKVAAWYDGSK